MNKNLIINYSVVGVLSAATGFGVGYILAKKKFLAVADEEIRSVRETFHRAQLPKPDLESVVEAYKDAAAVQEEAREVIEDAGYVAVQEAALIREYPATNDYADPEAEASQREFEKLNELNKNIFSDHGDQTVLERTPNKPYVISADDYADTSHDHYTKENLVYYVGDNTLTEENEDLIPNIDDVVGNVNLTYFGVFSQDPDLLHIRRDDISTDYEIAKIKGTYNELVLGGPPAATQEG